VYGLATSFVFPPICAVQARAAWHRL